MRTSMPSNPKSSKPCTLSPSTNFLSMHPYGLGMCIVLLVIITPLSTKRPTTGWNSNTVPAAQVPSGKLSSTQPLLTQYDINAAIESDVGIGVPSKYLLLPVASFGTLATVMLKRANLVRPQRTKKARKRWSTGVRSPMAKAAAAGDMPKDIYGAVSAGIHKSSFLHMPYQICQRVKLLTHETALLSPSRNLAIHEIKK